MKAKYFLGISLMAGLSLGMAQGGTLKADQDPFHWLQSPKSARALAWERSQTKRSHAEFAVMGEHAAILKELKGVLKGSVQAPSYALLGKLMVRERRDASAPYGVVEVADRMGNGKPGKWRVVLDIGKLRQKEGKPYELHFFSEYGIKDVCLAATERCLVKLSPQGGDEVEIRELDLKTGKFVTGGFRSPVGRTEAVWLNPNKVLIATTLPGETVSTAGWPEVVHLWTRGTNLKSSLVVYRGKHSDALLMLSAMGDGPGRKAIINRAMDYSDFQILTVSPSGKVAPTIIPQKIKAFGQLGANQRFIFFQLADGLKLEGKAYPAETLMAYDTKAAAGKRVSAVFTPKGASYVNDTTFGVMATKNHYWFVEDHHLEKHLMQATYSAKGWQVREVLKDTGGNSLTMAAAGYNSDDLLIKQDGFIMPTKFSLVRGGKAEAVYAQPAAFDASDMTVEIRHARSKDGTVIDYYLARPKHLSHPGQTPTLITAYGAFGISSVPEYLGGMTGGPAMKLWFERGGALAMPIIRGGGERGEAWHKAAMREKRQNSYEDFLATVRDLEHGFTTARHLGVFGMSNGGLLSATVTTEAPELFGASVIDVPLTDMLRFPQMGMGSAWEDEYGDPSKPEMARALMKYSPYQNVKDGVHYNPVMLTAATSDNRVGPGHARKMAARLEQAGAKHVYYIEDEEGGHGVSDALMRPNLVADRMTFFIHYLMK